MRLKLILLFCFAAHIAFAQNENLDSIKNATGIFKDVAIKPRMRIIIDNDFSGDPDGLFALVHFLLSPSVNIRGIIGSHLPAGQSFGGSKDSTATSAVKKINEVLHVMNFDKKFAVYEGANSALKDTSTPKNSAAAKAIVEEAIHGDTSMPLYVVCGAGLTDVASAYLMQPQIANRLTLIWIGGPEYADLAAPPPNADAVEYNLCIDLKAAQVVFNASKIHVWQVPRNAYRQVIMPYSTIAYKVKNEGAVGAFLYHSITNIMQLAPKWNFNLGEVYIIGDSPLVLLTALQSSFQPDASSSTYVLKDAPVINNDGQYETNANARQIRVYNQIDTRLIFDDFFSKLSLFNDR